MYHVQNKCSIQKLTFYHHNDSKIRKGRKEGRKKENNLVEGRGGEENYNSSSKKTKQNYHMIKKFYICLYM